MDNYKNIGKRIKEERQTLKLTQKELAERAGIDFRFLGNIERGVSKPSLDTVVKISKALDMPLDILVAERVLHKNPPENSPITKEIVRLMKMLTDSDAKKVLKLIRCAIELFTGEKVSIPNEIQSHLKDERTVYADEQIERFKRKAPRRNKTEHKGLSRFWETPNRKDIRVKNTETKIKKLKPQKKSKIRYWLV